MYVACEIFVCSGEREGFTIISGAPPNQLANLGLGITVSWAVEATCCLVVMRLFYILGEWLWRRTQHQRKPATPQ